MGALPRAVKTLGAVSLLTDASSEMIYPLLPAFLTGTLGAGPAFLGLVEGAAEAAASLLKIAAGYVSDRLGRRKPLVVAGYTLSSVVRPLVAAASAPWHVLAVRVADRIGKGTRGAPRDALIAQVTPVPDRGRAFGFQRGMDHAGAAVGPLLATAVLWLRHDLRLVFALAAVPAAASVALLALGVREPPPAASHAPVSPAGDAAAAVSIRGPLARYLVVLAVFTLGNSSDAFLLLRAQQAGVALAMVPALWAFHHVVKAAASTHAGALSDRWGRRTAILAGWAVYAGAYVGFAAVRTAWQVWALFGVYGLFHALTEGAERALIADLARAGERGRAFGLYHAVTGGMLLPASVLTGALWQAFGAAVALLTGATLAGAAAAGLLLLVPARHGGTAQSAVGGHAAPNR
jgi:MFS family permease